MTDQTTPASTSPPPPSNDRRTLVTFVEAGAILLDSVLCALRTEDTETLRIVHRMQQAGGLLSCTCTLSAAGLVHVGVHVHDSTGEKRTLIDADLSAPAPEAGGASLAVQ